jgi:hypothetical protein
VKNECGFAAKSRRGPKIALLEQALRPAELLIRRMFSAVNPNVEVFSDHDIN